MTSSNKLQRFCKGTIMLRPELIELLVKGVAGPGAQMQEIHLRFPCDQRSRPSDFRLLCSSRASQCREIIFWVKAAF